MEDLSLTLFAPLSNASQKGSGCSLPSGADFHYYMMNPAYKARVLALRSTVQKTAQRPTSHGRWTPDGTGPKSQLAFEDGVDNANVRAVLSTLRYQPWQTEAAPPQLPLGFDTTPYTFVDTPQGLREMAVKLEAAREIAVDLEAHSYRSFQGFTCLIQLSTRAADYVVDALALRSHIGPLLGPIFADPGKLKVLHGSDCDIVWLQRDFGIYVANLFDTGQAARVLQYPGHGLAFLMDHFCSIKADKRYQLADWRQRPLSPEMEAYARADTHYLLFIYDKMREELLASKESVPPHLAVDLPEHGPSGALGTVLERSRTLCMLQYEREQCREDSFLQAALKLDVVLSGPQLAVFEALYNWRDGEARTQDESPGFICPRAQLVALALAMPTTGPEVAAALGRRARYVLLRAREVAAVVAGAAARQARVEELRREYLLAGGRAHKNQAGPEDVARVEPESREPEDAATNADPELATPGPAPTATLEPAAGSAKRALRPRGIKRPLVLGSTGKGLGAALIAAGAVPRALAAIRASLTLPFAKQPAGVADGEAAEAPSAHAPEEAKATEGDALEQAEPTTAAEVRSAMEAMRGVAAPAGPRGPRDDLADYLPLSLNERAGKKARQYEAGRRHAAARLAASEGGDPTPGAERGFQAFDYSTAKDAFKNTIPRGGMYNPYGGGDSGIKPGKKSSVNPRSGNRSASFRGSHDVGMEGLSSSLSAKVSFKALAPAACPTPRKTPDYESLYSQVGKACQPGILRTLVAEFSNVPGVVSMAGGLPPPDVFPIAEMSVRLHDGTVVDVPDLGVAQQYNLTLHGLPALRAWAEREVAARQRPACATETMISNGANHALEMMCNVFLDAGDALVLEEYHYPVVTEGHTLPRGVEALGVAIDAQGIVPASLEANPTGAVVTRERMAAVYRLCRRYGLLILEDDPYYYLQYPAGPEHVPGTDLAPGYLSLDLDGRVVRVDTFAKMMAPGLRLGWITGPPPVVAKLLSCISYSTAGPSTISSAIALAVLRAWGPAGYETHIRAIQRHYAAKAAAVHAAAQRHLAGLADWEQPRAGMFLWITLRGIPDSARIWEAMREAKVVAVPGGALNVRAGTPGFASPAMRISFSYNTPEQVEEGLRRLAAVIRSEMGGAPA
ncbi:Exosome component 10 [Auxenochlorella protothecoides]|uniref:Exosome component 10 n=1 Tax=Auxenochlorella protothecoides TaxID=3075 RepID=A0A087SLI3_AUXPR|nr:Exosome component 10 [Auxenochlorella protothecoides]KFM26587.1 Exosome component 10 [Auxenochlorella protothecoides]